MKYFIEDKWVDEDQAVLPVSDLAIQRGVALFESIRTYNKKPFRIEQHIDRILGAAGASNFQSLKSKDEITKLVSEGLEFNQKDDDLAVRIMITAGSGSLKKFGQSRLMILFSPLDIPSDDQYKNGIKIATYTGPRFLADRKHTDYYSAALGLQEAAKISADDILYRDENKVYETATGNIFAIKGDALITPKSGILPGLTRRIVIDEIAPDLGLGVQETDLTYEGLISADEVFITGSLKEILAVSAIDNVRITPEAGDITRQIHELYKGLVS